MNEILQVIKEQKDLQDVYEYLYKPMFILEDIEKKFKSLNVKDKTREVNLDVPYKIDRIKNHYLPQIINTYLNFDIHYRNNKTIQSSNGKDLTAKDMLLNQISKVLEEIELIEEIYYLNNQQQFLVNGVLVDKLGYEDSLIDSPEKHITLKNSFDYEAYEKELDRENIQKKQEDEIQLENEKILKKAKEIQDEKDRKELEKQEAARLAQVAEQQQVADAKKFLEEIETRKKLEEAKNAPQPVLKPQNNKNIINSKKVMVIAGMVTPLIVGIGFAASGNSVNDTYHQAAQHELKNISYLYNNLKDTKNPTEEIEDKFKDSSVLLESNASLNKNIITIGHGKAEEKITLENSYSFDVNKTDLKISYHLPKVDGDACFSLTKDLTENLSNIKSISVNDIELTKEDKANHSVIINNDKIFQACTNGASDVVVNLGKN